MNIDIEITKVHHDFYETNKNILNVFPGRRCFGCWKKFKLYDMVSVALTDRGNKLFHAYCLRGLGTGRQ